MASSGLEAGKESVERRNPCAELCLEWRGSLQTVRAALHESCRCTLGITSSFPCPVGAGGTEMSCRGDTVYKRVGLES